MTLLQKARQVARSRKEAGLTVGHAELAIAWVKREITSHQVAPALEKKSGNIYAPLALGLSKAFELGMLVEPPSGKSDERRKRDGKEEAEKG